MSAASPAPASRSDVLLESLLVFYSPSVLALVRDVVQQRSNVSLRLLDWLVTSFSKRTRCVYKHNGRLFDVYVSYKTMLKAYSKKSFDPFCRRRRIMLNISRVAIVAAHDRTTSDVLETTIGQLNFFRWAIQNAVLLYVQHRLVELETDLRKHVNSMRSARTVTSITTHGDSSNTELKPSNTGVGGACHGDDQEQHACASSLILHHFSQVAVKIEFT